MSKKNYSTTKSQFFQKQYAEGATQNQANNRWHKSEEKARFDNTPSSGSASGDDIDRSFESPSQDWASTSEDF